MKTRPQRHRDTEDLPVFRAQLLSYLHLTGKKVGLLVRFHVLYLRQGLVRLVL